MWFINYLYYINITVKALNFFLISEKYATIKGTNDIKQYQQYNTEHNKQEQQ